MRAFRRFFLFAISLAAFSGCVKEETFPVQPVITFKEATILSSDSLRLAVTFTDGDGDIGLAQGDTFSPYLRGTRYYTNLWVTYLYDSSGVFVPYDVDATDPDMDSLSFDGRIPRLTEQGQKQSLTGDIIEVLSPIYALPAHTRFKYRIALVDRSLNVSNFVETPVLSR